MLRPKPRVLTADKDRNEGQSSERHGPWSLLSSPLVYEAFHHLIGARRWLKRFAREVVHAKAGELVLDVGCGPGALFRYLPRGTSYVGFDRNHAYIAQARREHGSGGTFICDDVSRFTEHAIAPADVAVLIGVLHHLNDDLARTLTKAIADCLKPGGRLVTADPCYHEGQSPLQRFIVGNDRGMHVRPFEQYARLCVLPLSPVTTSLQSGHLPFPHSICVMEAVRQPSST
jgi:SAM-dependent methyltransferase